MHLNHGFVRTFRYGFRFIFLSILAFLELGQMCLVALDSSGLLLGKFIGNNLFTLVKREALGLDLLLSLLFSFTGFAVFFLLNLLFFKHFVLN